MDEVILCIYRYNMPKKKMTMKKMNYNGLSISFHESESRSVNYDTVYSHVRYRIRILY